MLGDRIALDHSAELIDVVDINYRRHAFE